MTDDKRSESLTKLHDIRQFVQAAARSDDEVDISHFRSVGEAQLVLDEVWKVLDSPALLDAATGGSQFYVYRNSLRRLTLKVAVTHNILPAALILRGVKVTDNSQHGAGGFADVFCGTYDGTPVAVKKLRVYIMSTESQKRDMRKAFCRESILWKNLVHEHIVPFLGVAEDIFEGTLCMILPWLENGSLRRYLDALRVDAKVEDAQLVLLVDKWLYQTALGLGYLHGEGIVHGDLHAGNILVDNDGNARLTDFGMSLIAEATAYNYASMHGGGATRWQAPELIDPEEFDMESTRPTPQSDVFSLACTAAELYTGKPPFPELTDRQVSNRYIRGIRPPKPSAPVMPDELWALVRAWWSQDIASRPSAHEIAISLAPRVPGVGDVDELSAKLRSLAFQESVTSMTLYSSTSSTSTFLDLDLDPITPFETPNSFITRFDALDETSFDNFPDVIDKILLEYYPRSDLPDEHKQYLVDHSEAIGSSVLGFSRHVVGWWKSLGDEEYDTMIGRNLRWQKPIEWLAYLRNKRFTGERGPIPEDEEMNDLDDEEGQQTVLNMWGPCKRWTTWVARHTGHRCSCGNKLHTMTHEQYKAIEEGFEKMSEQAPGADQPGPRSVFMAAEMMAGMLDSMRLVVAVMDKLGTDGALAKEKLWDIPEAMSLVIGMALLIKQAKVCMMKLNELAQVGLPNLDRIFFDASQVKEFENTMYPRVYWSLVWAKSVGGEW